MIQQGPCQTAILEVQQGACQRDQSSQIPRIPSFQVVSRDRFGVRRIFVIREAETVSNNVKRKLPPTFGESITGAVRQHRFLLRDL